MSAGADAVVIGAGMSGLVDAILLAETGRRVTVLEQHGIPGGYLQQFRRKQTVFDVGFHYMGSTSPGRPIRQMLEHLKVFDRLSLLPFPDDAAIEVRSGERRFAYPTRFDRFVEKAHATWPHERDAIERLANEVSDVCGLFKWFDLKKGKTYGHPLDFKLSPESFEHHIDYIEDPWLKEALGFQSFNLGLFPHEIPWAKHALAFRSNFDVTCRLEGGGGALAAALVERGSELGVTYRFKEGAAGFFTADRLVRAVTTEKGVKIEADLFVAACHPKAILRLVPDDAIKPMFKQRVLDLKESRGALQVFLRLKEPLETMGATCVMIRDDREAAGDPPLDTVLVTYPTAIEGGGEGPDRGGPRLEAMTYMDQAPFRKWRDLPVMRRGEDYERFKAELAARMIGMIEQVVPELRERITDTYAATPLSDEWYTRNEQGGVFGVSHDLSQQGMNRPLPRMRLRNLFFSGHSLTMPGICGVFINAFDTCDAIRGDEVLFDAIAT